MWLWTSFMLALSFSGCLWLVIRWDHPIGVHLRGSGAFHLFALLALVAVDANVIIALHAGAPPGLSMGVGDVVVFVSIASVLGLAGLPFVMFLVGEYVDAARRAAMSEDNIKVARTFDQSEAAIKRRDYPRAEELLREAIAEEPQEPEPHRRVADVLLLRGNLDGCIRELREAAALTKEAEPRTVILFRIFDLLVDRAHDVAAAAAQAKAIQREFPGSPFAEMAQARLDRLRQMERRPIG